MWAFSVAFAVFTMWLCSANATFNLFMNQTEAKRVLGEYGRCVNLSALISN